MSKDVHENISPTAWGVAYRRTLTDIPYSKEIFEELEKIRLSGKGFNISADLKHDRLAPMFEARHKLVHRLLLENKSEQILEMASGLSPHGLEMTENPAVKFSEMDLPIVVRQKELILKELVSHAKIKPRQNLHLNSGNVLNLRDLENAARFFYKNKGLIVVNEGLLRYLSFKEKDIVAQNIAQLLKMFKSGIWITPDIQTLNNMGGKFVKEDKNWREITKIEVEKNYFEDEKHATEYFESFGFSVKRHSFMEVYDQLVSPYKLGQDKKQAEEIMGLGVVFVMRLK
jgi:O-methyltransferase involved in polyketide biosynthesis